MSRFKRTVWFLGPEGLGKKNLVDELSRPFKLHRFFSVSSVDELPYGAFSTIPDLTLLVVFYSDNTPSDVKTSVAFVDWATGLKESKVLLINCSNYDTKADRDTYVSRYVRLWLKGKRLAHERRPGYGQTFFNPKQRLWFPGLGFSAGNVSCHMIKTCEIGRYHCGATEFGLKYKAPTGACGNSEDPKYVFVGEAPGRNGCGATGLPFYGDLSGNMLYDAFDRCGIIPTQYYITNVVKCTPKENDLAQYGTANWRHKELWCVKELLASEIESHMIYGNTPKLIALGKVAHEALTKLGWKHKWIYHPAYYMRSSAEAKFFKDFKGVLDV